MSVCAACNPPVHGDQPVDERHVAVRFGQHGPEWTVLLDGEDVTNQCVEAMAGHDGWVLLHDIGPDGRRIIHGGPASHLGHVFTRQEHGTVQVIRRPRRPTDA